MKKIILNEQTKAIPEKSLEHPDYHPPKKSTPGWLEPFDEDAWDDDPNPYHGTYSEE